MELEHFYCETHGKDGAEALREALGMVKRFPLHRKLVVNGFEMLIEYDVKIFSADYSNQQHVHLFTNAEEILEYEDYTPRIIRKNKKIIMYFRFYSECFKKLDEKADKFQNEFLSAINRHEKAGAFEIQRSCNLVKATCLSVKNNQVFAKAEFKIIKSLELPWQEEIALPFLRVVQA